MVSGNLPTRTAGNEAGHSFWVCSVWPHGDIAHRIYTARQACIRHPAPVGVLIPNLEVQLTREVNGEVHFDPVVLWLAKTYKASFGAY